MPGPPSPDAGRSWPTRFGLAIDRVLNVVFLNGDDTWTVSLHAAVARDQGRDWGCVLCGALGVLVQANHCDITLDPKLQETPGAAAKAGALMALVLGALWVGVHFFFKLIF